MSKRNHHRGNGINVNDLAEALTRNGWQQPAPGGNHPGQMPNSQGFPGMNMANPMGNNQLSNNLGALGNLLGAVSGGGQPQMPMGGSGIPTVPMSGGMPQMNGSFPQMPLGGNMPQMPMPGMMPQQMHQQMQQHKQTPLHQTTDTDLLKNLFQEILKLLKEK